MILQLLLLGLLLQGEKHGYQLGQYVAHAMGLYTNFKKPTIYYTLDKLAGKGYIQSSTEKKGNRPERRVYEITESGKGYFFDLLRQQIADYTQPHFADDIGIGFLDLLPATEAHELLLQKRDKIQQSLVQFQEVPDHGGNWQQVMQHNIAHLRADLTWLEQLIQERDKD